MVCQLYMAGAHCLPVLTTRSASMPASCTSVAANIAFVSAILCAVCIALLTFGGGLFTPGYSHLAQFISELGARGALHEDLVRYAGFLPSGLFLLVYCVAAHVALPRAASKTIGLVGIALYAAGYVVAAFMPCDLGCRPAQPSASQVIHNAVGMLGYLAAPPAMCFLAYSAGKWPRANHLVWLGYVAAAFALLGMLTLAPESPLVGLSQRVIETAVLAWIVTSGVYMRNQASAKNST